MTPLVLSVALVASPVVELEKKAAPARDKAIDFLKKQQKADGTWEGVVIATLADLEGGTTGLVALALLEAGVPPKDPAVAKAVEYLVKLEPKKTYVVSLQTRVLARVDAKAHANQLQANADWLVKNGIGWRVGDDGSPDGKLRGWSYPQNDIADGSNTHFAVLGLHAAAQAGAKVDGKVWAQVRELYSRTQIREGTWRYYGGGAGEGMPVSVSMTGAALVGLTLAARNEKTGKPDPAFDKGMAAYLAMFQFEAPKSTAHHLMVVAELGRLLGVTEFKSGAKARAWYREGVEKLVKEQKEDGSWAFGRLIDGTPVLATAFGLYFLGPPAGK
ncbi:MAG: hypothetical protein C0501_08165 [Isosphaera sp.]|nr:hypothetical protein [Isosphaera sp.]